MANTARKSATAARVSQIFAAALEVWKTADDARRFLEAPHPLLGMRSPVDLATEDLDGTLRVEELLGQIKYGTAP